MCEHFFVELIIILFLCLSLFLFFFFFNDTATTEIYTLSLHDALPICQTNPGGSFMLGGKSPFALAVAVTLAVGSALLLTQCNDTTQPARSEEHTSELQSQSNLVCRLLLEKKKKKVERDLLDVRALLRRAHYYFIPMSITFSFFFFF